MKLRRNFPMTPLFLGKINLNKNDVFCKLVNYTY